MSELVIKLMKHNGVCKTSLATPGKHQETGTGTAEKNNLVVSPIILEIEICQQKHVNYKKYELQQNSINPQDYRPKTG